MLVDILYSTNQLTPSTVKMKNTISNRTPEGTCSGDVVGGLTVTGEAFGRFYLGRRCGMEEKIKCTEPLDFYIDLSFEQLKFISDLIDDYACSEELPIGPLQRKLFRFAQLLKGEVEKTEDKMRELVIAIEKQFGRIKIECLDENRNEWEKLEAYPTIKFDEVFKQPEGITEGG